MANNAGPSRRFIISKNLIMMLVVLVAGLLAVWSWFTVNKVVTANNISVRSAFPNEIGLAEVNYDENGNDRGPKTFSGKLEFNTDVTLTKDCTGDGESLIVPSFSIIKDKDTATKKGREVSIGGAWEDALSQTEVEKIRNVNPDFAEEPRYIEYEFYARSQTKDVTLASTSYLSASNEHLNDSEIPAGKKSSYGNFSSDSIVGAVRVALLAQGAYVEQDYPNGDATTKTLEFHNEAGNVSYKRHLTCLWLPRPDIKMNVSNTGKTNDWTLERDIKYAGQTPLAPTDSHDNDITYFHTYYKPAGAGTPKSPAYEAKWKTNSTQYQINKNEGVVVQKKTAGTDEHFVVTTKESVKSDTYPVLGTDFKASSVGASESDYLRTSRLRQDAGNPDSETNYYVYKYTLRIWLEGEDLESRRAMDGGQFNLHLEFK